MRDGTENGTKRGCAGPIPRTFCATKDAGPVAGLHGIRRTTRLVVNLRDAGPTMQD